MSTRLEQCYSQLRQSNRKALVPYIVAGDPAPEITVPLMHALVESGANVIELGVPFSDPMADGPSIQMGHERALQQGVSCHRVLEMVSEFRREDTSTPVLLMGYLNPIDSFGYQDFAKAAADAGVDALLIVDLPPEEAKDLKQALNALEIDLIFLVAPTTDSKRLKLIYEQASGFLYYVSLKGVTGAGNLDVASVEEKVSQIRRLGDLPVNVGFGVKDGQSAAALARFCDGIVIGSKLVDQCAAEELSNIQDAISGIIREIRSALDN